MIVHEKQNINRLVQTYCPRPKDLFVKYGYRVSSGSGTSNFGEVGDPVNLDPTKIEAISQGEALYNAKLASEAEARRIAAEKAAQEAAEKAASSAVQQ